MKINRYAELRPYEAAGHFDMTCLRVQGHEASPSTTCWMGLSLLEPGGHTTLNPSVAEKMYVVLEGAVTFTNGDDKRVLERLDSCYFEPNERRELRNETTQAAAVLLVMPYVKATG